MTGSTCFIFSLTNPCVENLFYQVLLNPRRFILLLTCIRVFLTLITQFSILWCFFHLSRLLICEMITAPYLWIICKFLIEIRTNKFLAISVQSNYSINKKLSFAQNHLNCNVDFLILFNCIKYLKWISKRIDLFHLIDIANINCFFSHIWIILQTLRNYML